MTESNIHEAAGRTVRYSMAFALVAALGVGFTLQNSNTKTAQAQTLKPAVTITPSPSQSQDPSPGPSSSSTSAPDDSASPVESPSDRQPLVSQPRSARAIVNPDPFEPRNTACNMTMEDPESADLTALQSLGKCKVLIVGDSLGNNLGWGLVNQLSVVKGLKLYQRAKSSTGLSNSWFYDWPSHLKTYLAQYKPDLVIIMMGANDHQDMKVNGSSARFGTSKWNNAYTASMRKMISMSTDSGAYVMWVGLPVMKNNRYGKAMGELDAIYEKTAPTMPGTTFLSMWDLMAAEDGSYRQTVMVNKHPIKMRGEDGIHFTLTGQDTFAGEVIRQMSKVYRVKLGMKRSLTVTG